MHGIKPVVFLFRNLESLELPVFSAQGHKEIINCIDGIGGLGIGEGAPELVTGSRDGRFELKNNNISNQLSLIHSPFLKCLFL